MTSLLMFGLIVVGGLLLGKIVLGGANAGGNESSQEQPESPRHELKGNWADGQYDAKREERFDNRQGMTIGEKIGLAIVAGFVLAVVILLVMAVGSK